MASDGSIIVTAKVEPDIRSSKGAQQIPIHRPEYIPGAEIRRIEGELQASEPQGRAFQDVEDYNIINDVLYSDN